MALVASMNPSAMSSLSEVFGDELPQEQLNRPFLRMFEDTAAEYPDRLALVSMWQSKSVWEAAAATTSGHGNTSVTTSPEVTTPEQDPVPEAQKSREGGLSTSSPHSPSAALLPISAQPLSASSYIRWTYRELDSRASGIAVWLRERGSQPGQMLVSFLGNSVEWAVFFWAAAKVGMTFVPLDARTLVVAPDEARYLLLKTRPSVVVVQDMDGARAFDQLWPVTSQKTHQASKQKEPQQHQHAATTGAEDRHCLKINPINKVETSVDYEAEHTLLTGLVAKICCCFAADFVKESSEPATVHGSYAATTTPASTYQRSTTNNATAPSALGPSVSSVKWVTQEIITQLGHQSTSALPSREQKQTEENPECHTASQDIITTFTNSDPKPNIADKQSSPRSAGVQDAHHELPSNPETAAYLSLPLMDPLPRSSTMHPRQSSLSPPTQTVSQPAMSIPLLLFTSGTTRRPKGCPHTPANLWSATHEFDPHTPAGLLDRWLVHTPVSHVFAVNNALRAWRHGHAVVFAARWFDAGASARALLRERCTIMSAVPQMVVALANHPDFLSIDGLAEAGNGHDANGEQRDDKAGDDQDNTHANQYDHQHNGNNNHQRRRRTALRYVTLGGTLISEAHVREARTLLDAEAAIQGFGMTEGIPLISWRRPDPLLRAGNGWHDGVGKALPGVRVRVCVLNTQTVVPRGHVGELHVGGTTVIEGYYVSREGKGQTKGEGKRMREGEESGKGEREGATVEWKDGEEEEKANRECFYDDEHGRWLCTGDQVMMDADGVVHLLGRYKDMIIRGGENINPAKIETALVEAQPGLEVQVVGLPDEFSGEVPVAVVNSSSGRSQIDWDGLGRAALQLGPMHALSRIYSLKDLGLDAWPKTNSGKIKKQVLRTLVREKCSGIPALGVLSPTAGAEETNFRRERLSYAGDEVAVTTTTTQTQLSPAPEAQVTNAAVIPMSHRSNGIFQSRGESKLRRLSNTDRFAMRTSRIEARRGSRGSRGPGSMSPVEVRRRGSIAELLLSPSASEGHANVEKEASANQPQPQSSSPLSATAVDNERAVIATLQSIVHELTQAHLDPDDNLTLVLDSLSMLKYYDMVQRRLSIRIPFYEFLQHLTMRRQAALVVRRSLTSMMEGLSRGGTLPLSAPGPSIATVGSPGLLSPPPSMRKKPAVASIGSGSFDTKNFAVAAKGFSSRADPLAPPPAPPSLLPSTTSVVYAPNFPIALPTPPLASHAPIITSDKILATLGLQATDIEQELPIRTTLHRFAAGLRPQAYNNRLCFRISPEITSHKIYEAACALIARHPMFRAVTIVDATSSTTITAGNSLPIPQSSSVVVPSFRSTTTPTTTTHDRTPPRHIILPTCNALLKRLVTLHMVPDMDSAREFLADEAETSFPHPFAAQIAVIQVLETGSMYVRFTLSHASFDSISLAGFYRDFDRLLDERQWYLQLQHRRQRQQSSSRLHATGGGGLLSVPRAFVQDPMSASEGDNRSGGGINHEEFGGAGAESNLEDCLSDIEPRTPFAQFAEVERAYSMTTAARANIDFHVRRLRGLSQWAGRALFPRPQAPGGWMVSGDKLAWLAPEIIEARQEARRHVWAGRWDEPGVREAFRFPRRSIRSQVPGLDQLLVDMPQAVGGGDAPARPGGDVFAVFSPLSDFDVSRGDVDGRSRSRALKLRIRPYTLVKAALALLNMVMTGEDFAIFNTIEHGRSWPFVSAWRANMLPSIMSVDGPTLAFVLNPFKLPRASSAQSNSSGWKRNRTGMLGTDDQQQQIDVHEKPLEDAGTVAAWLRELELEQRNIELHVHAPWDSVLAELGEEAEMAREASVRQTLVWDVSLALLEKESQHKHMVSVGRYDWADSGLFWNVCNVDATNLLIVATWDTVHLNDIQVDGLIEGLADLTQRLGDPGNLHMSVEDVLQQHCHSAVATGLYSGFALSK